MGTGHGLVITGGASGIGAAIVREALGRGWAVAFCDVSAKEKLPTDLLTGHALFMQADVRKPESMKAFREATVAFMTEKGVPPNKLAVVACAGISRRGDPEQVKLMEDINVGGTRNLLTAFQPDLNGGRGVFISLSSIVAAEGVPIQGDEAYQATKVETRRIATEETARLGIHGFAMAPGAIDTPMLRQEAIMAMLLLAASKVFGGNPDHPMHSRITAMAGTAPGATGADVLKALLGSAITGTEDFAKVDKALAKDPSLSRAGAALFTGWVCPKGPDNERRPRPEVIDRAATILKELDVVIGPETVARTMLNQVESGKVPPNGLLRAYSERGGNPIVELMTIAAR